MTKMPFLPKTKLIHVLHDDTVNKDYWHASDMLEEGGQI